MEEVNPNHLPFELTKEFIEDIRLLIENQANEELLLKLDELTKRLDEPKLKKAQMEIEMQNKKRIASKKY